MRPPHIVIDSLFARRGLLCAVCLIATTSARAQRAPASHAWTPIFDGRSLAGWKGAARFGIEEGTLVLPGVEGMSALCTEKSYGDFVLRFRARTTSPGSNAEVLFRA